MKPLDANGTAAPQGAATVSKGRGAEPHPETIRDSRFTIHADAAALAAEAHDLEARLAKYRDWYAKMAAEERRLLDALKAHRERWASGNAKGHALSARLTGIWLRLRETRENAP